MYDKGSEYGISLGFNEIYNFRNRWPASGLGGLNQVYFGFAKRNGDLIETACNRNGDCSDYDGGAFLALSRDAQCLAQHKLKLPMDDECGGNPNHGRKPDWHHLSPKDALPPKAPKSRKRTFEPPLFGRSSRRR